MPSDVRAISLFNHSMLGLWAKWAFAYFIFFGLSAVIYWPALSGSFIWDDLTYIVDNPILRSDHVLRKLWFSHEAQDYWPVTYTVVWLEWLFFGARTFGYHLINLLVHASVCVLIWNILRRLRFPFPICAAIFFCVHPINVESVAWIFQIKTSLAAALTLGATLFYLRTLDRFRKLDYLIAIGLFALANLTKILSVTWPFVLLGLEWHRAGYKIKAGAVKRLVPFFAVSLVLGLLNVFWYPNRDFLPQYEAIRDEGFLGRFVGAGQNVLFYLCKMIVPKDFIFIYPRWDIDITSFLSWLPSVLISVAVLMFLWGKKYRSNPVLLSVIYVLITLFPVLGFIDVTFMRYSWVADHYAYLTLPGVIMLVLVYVDQLVPWSQVKMGMVVFSIMGLGLLTNWRSEDYAEASTLWERTLEKNPTAWIARNNLGIIRTQQGLVDQSIAHYRQALQIKRELPETYFNLGNALKRQGKLDEAIESYREAIKYRRYFPEPYYNLGSLLTEKGQVREAIEYYLRAIEINPNYAEAHYNVANLLADSGQVNQAITHYKEAIKSKPGYWEARFNFALLCLKVDRKDLAIEQYNALKTLNSEYADILGRAIF